MNRTRRNLVLVGIFVAVTGAILIGSLLYLAGANIFRRVDRYYVIFDSSVSGLAPGGEVQFQGVTVGRVQGIRLTDAIPPKVSVAIDVEPGTPIRKDTSADLVGSVVTGIKFIALTGGTEAAGPLEEGGVIPGSVTAFEQLGSQVQEIAARVLRIIERLDTEVFTKENNKKLGELVDDVSVLADSLRVTLEPFREEGTGKDLTKLIRHVRRAANNIDGLVSDLRKSQGTMVADVRSTLSSIERLATESNALVHGLRGELSGTGTSLSALLSDLTEATNRLEETLTVIQADPSLLLRGRYDGEKR
ncbi:MAG TPA: MlaD family protein [Candidatus Limnocylindria bacterium]|nr:MlaD family protein [Candidatus Limnocylindria bacterium]